MELFLFYYTYVGGIDYIVNISDLTVTFPAGPPVPACMNVTIIDDSISENNERFLLLILPNNVSGVSVGPVSRLQITIIDDDSKLSCSSPAKCKMLARIINALLNLNHRCI